MILVVGDCIEDKYIELETSRPCPEGDWPIVRESRRYSRPGGAAAVQDITSSREVSTCLIWGTGPHSVKTRVFLDGQCLYRFDEDRRAQPAVISSVSGSPDVVLIADYGKGAITRGVITECLSRGWRVVVDPHPSQDPSIYKGVYGICPNRQEHARHRYASSPEDWPRFCLKLDKDGLLAFDHGNQRHFPSTAVQPVVDVCGAGDHVLATIGITLSLGYSWLAACKAANFAAGESCAHVGVVPPTSTPALTRQSVEI